MFCRLVNICFGLFGSLRWNILEESNEKEIELEKFQTILQQNQAMPKSKLFHFLKEEKAKIAMLHSKIHLPLGKHESADSFQFLQALILFFFHSKVETNKNSNLIELVKIIISGCQKLPECSVREILIFLRNFAEQLKRENSVEEVSLIESLIAKMSG